MLHKSTQKSDFCQTPPKKSWNRPGLAQMAPPKKIRFMHFEDLCNKPWNYTDKKPLFFPLICRIWIFRILTFLLSYPQIHKSSNTKKCDKSIFVFYDLAFFFMLSLKKIHCACKKSCLCSWKSLLCRLSNNRCYRTALWFHKLLQHNLTRRNWRMW